MTNLVLDRKHRFSIGDRVRHVDAPDLATVTALTLRVRDGVAFPTYTLLDGVLGESVEDVLCTFDLVRVSS